MSGSPIRPRGVWLLLLLAAIPLAGCTSLMAHFGASMPPELQAHGVPASAEILELWDTGWTVNDSPVIGMRVRVHPEDRPDFEARIEKTTISRLATGQFQPGNVIPVRFDPQNPALVAVDFEPAGPAEQAGRADRSERLSSGNPYRDEYVEAQRAGVAPEPPPVQPAVYLGTSDSAADAQALFENNYVLIGGSGVHGGENLQQAIAQGKEVGAALVVVYGSFRTPQGGTLDVLPFRPRRLEPGGNVPAGWSKGLFTNLGAGDRFAAYWGKTRPAILGIVVRPLDASEQARYERGVVVDAVASGSPADDAKIAAGDVIVAIGGDAIGDPLAMPALVESHAGQSVRIDLVRNGSPLTVTAQLNPSSR